VLPVPCRLAEKICLVPKSTWDSNIRHQNYSMDGINVTQSQPNQIKPKIPFQDLRADRFIRLQTGIHNTSPTSPTITIVNQHPGKQNVTLVEVKETKAPLMSNNVEFRRLCCAYLGLSLCIIQLLLCILQLFLSMLLLVFSRFLSSLLGSAFDECFACAAYQRILPGFRCRSRSYNVECQFMKSVAG
jgi:hypothetical protein